MDWIIIGVLLAIGVYFAPIIIVTCVMVTAFLLSLPVMLWRWIVKKTSKDQW